MTMALRVMLKWTPPPRLTISEWANKFRKLSAESSAEPGDYSTDKAPYQKGIMDAITDRYTELVVFMAGSQLGKSEIENNTAGFFMDPVNGEPSPILIVQPTIQMAEDYSKDRIFPMIRDTPALRKFFKLKSRSGDNTLLHKRFPGGNLSLIGANSPASLASKPKRVLLADEIDRFPKSAGDEGDPFTLAVRRTATFLNRKIIAVSTPTIKGHSRIEALYESSDKRRYHVPCPHCKVKIVFQFGRLNWEKDAAGNYDPKTVRYLCNNCDAIIEETDKNEMLRCGEWIAEKPFTGTAGFHLNELYSPWRKWAEIVKDFLEAKKSPHTLKAWINTSLGETFEERGEAPEYAIVYQRREDYPAQVPARALFLTAGVDVQKDRIEIQVFGWGKNKERWVIDNRVIPGNTQFDEPWLKLDEMMSESFEHESGNNLMIRVLAIDSGFLAQRVYDWARKYPANRVLVVKGVEHQQSIISTPKALDIKRDGKKVRRGMKVWTVGTDMAKSELYGLLKATMPTDEEIKARGGLFPSGFIHFPKADFCDENYFKQLTAEALIPRTVRGFTKYIWVKVHERNEALDTAVYNRAAASFIGIDRFNEAQWDQLASASLLNIPGTKKKTQPKKTISQAQAESKTESSPKRQKTKKSAWLGR
jgi:phage terminase large subunit GpA-like protein